MQWIAHRINTAKQLADVPADMGMEIDLRDEGRKLILAHDPFVSGEKFADWLKGYRHAGPLILNIKSEQIEFRVLQLLKKHCIENYFFLDSSFPMIQKLIHQGENRIAVRYSEFEGLHNIELLQGRCQWVWVDCFQDLALDSATAVTLHKLGFQICLVSPDLQGRPQTINSFSKRLQDEAIGYDAVCIKQENMSMWRPPVLCQTPEPKG